VSTSARVAGQPPDPVALTHPASWGARRRGVLTAAAQAAGMPLARLVAEPVATARYFLTALADRRPVEGPMLVYDLGAGTFDASVVRHAAGRVEVLAAEGLPDAGGLDIDAAVVA
jgi:molecular chaperone DnaK (HSP70)